MASMSTLGSSVCCTCDFFCATQQVIFLSVLGGTFGPEIYHADLLQFLPAAIGCVAAI